MSTKIYKLNEVANAAGAYGYKIGEILNVQGQKAAPSHNVRIKPKKWLETTVNDFIKKPTTPPGIYYIYLYPDLAKKGQADAFPIQIGKVDPNLSAAAIPPAPIVINQQESKADHVLSYDAALKMQAEISDLKATVTRLTIENERLTAEIKELEEEEEPEQKTLSETAGSFLSQILPAADAWFKDRNAQRQMEFLKLKAQAPQIAAPYESIFLQPPAQAAPAQNNTNEILERAEAFFNTIAPEHYSEIELLKTGCTGYQQFFDKIKTAYPDTYAALYAAIGKAGAQ